LLKYLSFLLPNSPHPLAFFHTLKLHRCQKLFITCQKFPLYFTERHSPNIELYHFQLSLFFIDLFPVAFRLFILKNNGLTEYTYRVIHKSLRDFRPLRYSSRDGQQKWSMSTEGETLQVSFLPYRCSICQPLVTRQMSIL